MTNITGIGIRIIITLLVLAGLLYLPAPAFSQQTANVQNLLRNGGFEAGVQPGFGVGYEWGGFSNGNATVGWGVDTWEQVVVAGQNAQMIEIKNAKEIDRYGGIYQTIQVVPEQQYRLTIKGLIRSSEGAIEASDYGYRLQYAIDYKGGTAWELVSNDAWQELPWDEQPLAKAEDSQYRVETYNATITAESDQLTLFIRGWKKWINDGSGIFNLDEISLVGPVPGGLPVPGAQAAVLDDTQKSQPGETESIQPNVTLSESEQPQEEVTIASNEQTESVADNPASNDQEAISTEGQTSPQTQVQLPVSGQGQDETINYLLIGGVTLIVLLLGGAVINLKR